MYTLIKNFFTRESTTPKHVDYRAQEIWWCSTGERTAKGKMIEKPVLVFRKLGEDTFWGLPLAAKANATEAPMYFLASLRTKNRATALAKMRVLSSDQLVRRLGKISTAQFESVNASVLQFLAETAPVKPRVAPKARPVQRSTYRTQQIRTALRYNSPISAFTPAFSLRTR